MKVFVTPLQPSTFNLQLSSCSAGISLRERAACGSALLEEAGWLDLDGDPDTPRTAQGVPDVPDGTPLSFGYWTTEASIRLQVAQILRETLAQCGVQLEVQHFPATLKSWTRAGRNVSGYSNPEFDEARQAAREALPGGPGYIEYHHRAQEIFAEDLPAIPLFQALWFTVARADFCGHQMDQPLTATPGISRDRITVRAAPRLIRGGSVRA